MKETTGKQRLERLYRRLKKHYPEADIRFIDESLSINECKFPLFKVAFFIGEKQMLDAIWGYCSYGYEDNLLEFYDGVKEQGYITEFRAFNLFKEQIKEKE